MKLFFLSAQLQGLRIVDTFPWAFLFLGKIKKKLSKFDLITIIIYSIFLVYGLVIASDNFSFFKISIYLILSILATRISLNSYSNLTLKNFYLIILFGLIIEDILIKYFGLLSPFVRDNAGSFFVFREKSYFSLFLFSIISFSKKLKYSHIICLYFIGIFTQSGLFWVLFLVLIIYKLSRKINENIINIGIVPGLSIFYFYLNNLKSFESIYKFIDYADLLRLLINLTSWNSQCLGTLYIQQCVQNNIILDLSTTYFEKWTWITAQSTFFLLYNYFSYPGILLSIFIIFLMYRKIRNHKNFGFIFFNIIFQMFIQGFLLSPFFFWILSMREDKFLKK